MAYKFRKGVLQTDGVLTGSFILLDGDGTTSGSIAADAFYGDGSGLTGVTANAAGTDTQVQFNDGGTNLGGDSGLLFTKATNALTVVGDITASYLAIGAAFGQAGLSRGDISGSATLQVVGAAKLGNALAVSGAISSSATSATALAGEGLRLRDNGIISTPSANSLITLNDQEVVIAGNVSASSGGGFEGLGLTIMDGGTIATSVGTLLTLDSTNNLVTVGATISGSSQALLKGFGIVIAESGTIGGAQDTNLLKFRNGILEIGGRLVPDAGFGVNYAVAALGEGETVPVLSVGVNAFTGAIGRNHKVTLPATALGDGGPVAGDTVILKVNELAGYSVMITGSSESGSIDNSSVIGLSSSYASVTLVRSDTGGNWIII